MPILDATVAKYPPQRLREGMNEMPDGEKVVFIPSPSTGLWTTRYKLSQRNLPFTAGV